MARFSPVADEVVITRPATRSILLWPLSAARPHLIARMNQPTEGIIARFSGDGRRIIYGDGTSAPTVHDLRTGREVRLRGAPAYNDARLSSDGRQAAVVTADGRVLVWKVSRPGTIARRLVGHLGDIDTFDWAPDGRIVTAGADRTVRVWGARSTPLAVLTGHTDEVDTVAFAAGGRRILSTSLDGTVRLWDPSGGDALAVLQQGNTEVYDIAPAPDGTIADFDTQSVVHVFRCTVCGTNAAVKALAESKHAPPLTPAERVRYLANST
jgi:WD40 repeat protein